jgi:hypothetical protein
MRRDIAGGECPRPHRVETAATISIIQLRLPSCLLLTHAIFHAAHQAVCPGGVAINASSVAVGRGAAPTPPHSVKPQHPHSPSPQLRSPPSASPLNRPLHLLFLHTNALALQQRPHTEPFSILRAQSQDLALCISVRDRSQLGQAPTLVPARSPRSSIVPLSSYSSVIELQGNERGRGGQGVGEWRAGSARDDRGDGSEESLGTGVRHDRHGGSVPPVSATHPDNLVRW